MRYIDLTRSQREMYQYLVDLVKEGKPYEPAQASNRLSRTLASVIHLVSVLRSKGFISSQSMKDGELVLTKIIINETGESTPWPMSRIETPEYKMGVAELRVAYAAWLEKHGWTHCQVARAARIFSASLSDTSLDSFVRGGNMPPPRISQLRVFLKQSPEPGPFEDWRERVAREAVIRHHNERDQIVARIEAVEREREERRRQLLERERTAFTRKRADNDDTVWMDAATVRALSGGTLGRMR